MGFSSILTISAPSVLIRSKSFVGPKAISENPKLYLGKEGVTGLWFLEKSNSVNENDFNKLDVYYAKNQNIWLDLEIVGKSFSKMFFSNEK